MPATRSSRPGIYDREGADELCLPRHHRQPREPRHAARRGAAAPPSRCFMPLTVGGGVRTRRGRAARCCWPAPTRSRSTPPPWPGPSWCAEAAREVRQPMHRGRDRRQAGRRRADGRSSPMAAARPTGLDAVDWAERMAAARRRRDPADLDGPRRHQGRLRHRADPRGSPSGDGAGDRLGRGRHARSLVEGVRTATPPRVLAASIFHFGTYSIAEAKAAPGRGRDAGAAMAA